MSDYNSSLPIRTENAGDAIVKIADATTPSQQLKVNTDGSLNITDNESSITVDAVDLDIRDLAFATDKVDVSGSTVALDSTTLAALESITVQNGAGASAVNIQDGGNSITVDGTVELGATTLAALESINVQNTVTVQATDLDVRDLSHTQDSVKIGDGTHLLAVNTDGSLNVLVQDDVGTEQVDFASSTALAAGATADHDLTFATLSKLYQVMASASGKIKVEVKIETGAATDEFDTKAVGFNSTANPNIDLNFTKFAQIPLGAKVRVTITNKDNQAMDVYSTILGILG